MHLYLFTINQIQIISLAQAPKRELARSMRDESHLTSDKQHVGSTLEGLLAVTLQHHEHKTGNIFCLYRTEFKVPGS